MNGRIINRRVAEQGTVCHCCRRYMDEGEEYEENIEVLHHVNESYNMCPNCLTFADMYDVYSTLDGCVTRRVDFLYEVAKEAKATGWKCQECGKQCRRPGEPFTTHRNTLTVSHQDHDPMNCEPENLRALCAPCHLRYDRQHHAETRRRNGKRNNAERNRQ